MHDYYYYVGFGRKVEAETVFFAEYGIRCKAECVCVCVLMKSSSSCVEVAVWTEGQCIHACVRTVSNSCKPIFGQIIVLIAEY